MTFSKTVASGIRVDWIHARPELLSLFGRMRFAMGQNQLGLHIVTEFLLDGGFEPHLEKVRGIYQKKRDLLHAALKQEVSDFMDWTEPEGGFYFWVQMRHGLRAEDVWRTAVEECVAVNNGAGFYPGEDTRGNACGSLTPGHPTTSWLKRPVGCAFPANEWRAATAPNPRTHRAWTFLGRPDRTSSQVFLGLHLRLALKGPDEEMVCSNAKERP